MKVLSYDLNFLQIVERSVTRVYAHSPRLSGKLGSLRGVTTNHPVFDAESGTFVRAGEFRGGESLLRLSGKTTRIRTDTYSCDWRDPAPVYNFSVAGTETYFADDVLVHNKTDCRYIPGTRTCEGSIIPATGGVVVQGTGGLGGGGTTLVVPPLPDCAEGGDAGTPSTCLGGFGGIAGMGGKP